MNFKTIEILFPKKIIVYLLECPKVDCAKLDHDLGGSVEGQGEVHLDTLQPVPERNMLGRAS